VGEKAVTADELALADSKDEEDAATGELVEIVTTVERPLEGTETEEAVLGNSVWLEELMLEVLDSSVGLEELMLEMLDNSVELEELLVGAGVLDAAVEFAELEET
jgi:hypothetical protein